MEHAQVECMIDMPDKVRRRRPICQHIMYSVQDTYRPEQDELRDGYAEYIGQIA